MSGWAFEQSLKNLPKPNGTSVWKMWCTNCIGQYDHIVQKIEGYRCSLTCTRCGKRGMDK